MQDSTSPHLHSHQDPSAGIPAWDSQSGSSNWGCLDGNADRALSSAASGPEPGCYRTSEWTGTEGHPLPPGPEHLAEWRNPPILATRFLQRCWEEEVRGKSMLFTGPTISTPDSMILWRVPFFIFPVIHPFLWWSEQHSKDILRRDNKLHTARDNLGLFITVSLVPSIVPGT